MNRSLKFRTSDRKVFLSFVITFGAVFLLIASSRPRPAQSGAFAPLIPTASWTAAAPYPTTISRYAFAQNGADFYVLAGSNDFDLFDTLRRYNATTNVWTSLANIPGGGQAQGPAAFYGGKIYLTGDAGSAPDQLRIYDIATNTWSVGPTRPGVADSDGAAAGAFDGRVYVAGGEDSTNVPSSVLSIYNIASNTWNAGPSSPSPYLFGGYTQIGQFLYLIGGATSTSGVNSNVSMRLDMGTNTWSTGPNWTPRRADFALAAAGSRLFAMGGDSNGGNFFNASAQVNELNTSTWPTGAWVPSFDALPSARQGNQAGFFSTGRAGGEIWSTGGFLSAGFKDTTYLNEHIFRPVSVPCHDYHITASARPLVPATIDIGNHCNDCVTAIAFPFPVRFYGNNHTIANVSSNGSLQFGGANTSSTNTDLPAAGFNGTIFPFWDNLTTAGTGNGIFLSVTGAAPNRLFTIEWRVNRITGGATTRFEIRFLEGAPDFEIVYGATSGNFFGTIGAQRDVTAFTQFAGPTATVPAEGTRLLFTTDCCSPISFTGAIGSNSNTYPGSSGVQTGRVARGGDPSACGTQKDYPGTIGSSAITYDRYNFTNNGPATCVTFRVSTACTEPASQIYPVAYLGNFFPGSIGANYLGDPSLSSFSFEDFSVDVPPNATVVLVVSEVTPGGACPSYDVVVTGLSCPPELTKAASRKTHGPAGEFDIPLPLSGQPGVECRSSGGGNHKLVFTFNSEVTSGNAAVTAGVGSAGSPTFLGTTMTVPLSGVTDIQKITLTLSGVTNTVGQVLPNTTVSMNALLGDTTGNKAVNASDIGQTKSRSGQAANAVNFRSDTTVSGTINASDIGQVKANSGHSVP